MAEHIIEPWGEARSDYMLAQVCLILATAYSGKRAKFKMSDFMPFADTEKKPKRKQTAAQQEAVGRQLVQLFDKVKKGRG